MSFIVAITGGIASGKTTVSHLFETRFSVPIIDTDLIAREMVEPNTDGYQKILQHFGTSILNPDATLNRPTLKKIIFENEYARHWLEKVLHPLIFDLSCNRLKQIGSTYPYALLVIPLLKKNSPFCSVIQRTLVIDTTKSLQKARLKKRDGNLQIEAILKAQLSRKDRLRLADDVIINSNSLDELEKQVAMCHQRYIKLAEKYATS